jgi:D-apionolactonase
MSRSLPPNNAPDSPPPCAREFLRHGQPAAPTPLVPLRAGPIRMLYDPASGFVRHLHIGDCEILRGIYAAVRDQNWGTVPGAVRELHREIGPDHFRLEFQVTLRQETLHFIWNGTLRGDPDGTVQYHFDGEAKTNFLRNRIGLCILHPIQGCAGQPARQTRTDGRVVECRFPVTIEPQIFGLASFHSLRAVAHQVEPGLWAEVTFEGDVFEMEDQRNWTDASFKTYCTPLTLPFPVEIAAGTRVRQSACLRLSTNPDTSTARPVTITEAPLLVTGSIPSKPTGHLPTIGLGMSSPSQPLTPNQTNRLRAIAPAHLRADVRLDAPDWAVAWDQATHRARELGLGIELALHLPKEIAPDLNAVAEALRRTGVPLVRILVLRDGEIATHTHTLALVRKHFTTLDVPIGGGSDCHFCELNQEQALGHFALIDSDFLFWPISPQVHASDRLSLVESIQAQTDTVLSARAFAGDRPLVVSPITFKPRFHPGTTAPQRPSTPGELPPQVDPRQLSLFGAGWTLGSLAALSDAGAESVTYYETIGWRGVMETAEAARIPAQFPSRSSQVFPLYHLFGAVAGYPRSAPVSVSDPLSVTALALFNRAGQPRLLLANLTDSPRTVQFSGWSQSKAHLRCLDDDNVVEMTDFPDHFSAHSGPSIIPNNGVLTLDLPPFAFARIDP